MKKQIDAGVLGETQGVDVSFGFDLMAEIVYSAVMHIFRKHDLGRGVIVDFSIYIIEVSQWVFQETPLKVAAYG